MNLIQAITLGIVEGVTEFLPVSSTGHLLIAEHLLGIPEGDSAHGFAIAIQAGAILAVLWLYRQRVSLLVDGVIRKNPQGLRLLRSLLIAFFPGAFFGFLFDDLIETHLFGPWPIAIGWVMGAVVIFLFFHSPRHGGKGVWEIGDREAWVIGLAQCASLWPGTSRSLACLVGALLAGISMESAVEFTFLLGLITLGAATGYAFLKHGESMVESYGITNIVIGFVVAFFSAWISARWMIGWLKHRSLLIFALWRIGAAGCVALLRAFGKL
ncbi:MAG: undecaprenyl-diphosphate phosphatase [Sandaracinaceae bacterium]|nr:undecaprenyl-diphosphate phosphatase [Sandaracinaceae bacterium]MDW8246865.1 undecaprenyl-diphosphate phosphatase [Sandaracinaceae bacterium]